MTIIFVSDILAGEFSIHCIIFAFVAAARGARWHFDGLLLIFPLIDRELLSLF